MATLKIRKSNSEILTLPLTTSKPISRSLAICYNGTVYYNPLVHRGDSLDSGVKVNAKGDFALATQIYDPVLYDSSGRNWGFAGKGTPFISSRGRLYLDGASYLERTRTVPITKDMYFEFWCTLCQGTARNENQNIFSLTASTATRTALYLTSGNKLSIWLNNAAIKTSSSALELGRDYQVGMVYDNGVFKLYCDDWLGDVSKSLTAGNYTAKIGANATGVQYFAGEISNVEFYYTTETPNWSYLRFGN